MAEKSMETISMSNINYENSPEPVGINPLLTPMYLNWRAFK